MSVSYLSRRRIFRAALCTLACVAISAGVWAQDITTTTTMKGPSMYETAVRNGTVVYVSGNELVVKLSDGEVEHFIVSETQKFMVDGKPMTIGQLKPGTHLTQTITTATTPKMITTVRTIEGKVWHVNPPTYVILTLPDGTNKEYKVPKGQIFNVNGAKDTVFELRKGMNVSATVVKEEPVIEVAEHKAVTGVVPKPARFRTRWTRCWWRVRSNLPNRRRRRKPQRLSLLQRHCRRLEASGHWLGCSGLPAWVRGY